MAASAWGIAQYLSSRPPDSAAKSESQRRPEAASTASREIGIRAGTSFTTRDEAFTVHVAQVAKGSVKLSVSARTGDVYRFNKAQVGGRLVVPAPDGTYYVDLLRIRGDVVYLTMSKRQ